MIIRDSEINITTIIIREKGTYGFKFMVVTTVYDVLWTTKNQSHDIQILTMMGDRVVNYVIFFFRVNFTKR